VHSRWGWASPWAFALAALTVAGAIQFLYARIPSDADTAYHAAVGGLIREHGILRSFPWTSMSWLADHYADKELLFHLIFVPLGGLGWITASKVVGTLAGAAVLFAVYWICRQEAVRPAWLWALLPLFTSAAFLYRFTLVRPHLLSIALALLCLWAAARRRYLLLALLALVYPWTYVAWVLPLGMAIVVEVSRLVGGERPDWRGSAAAAAGLAVGLAVHPNAENLIRFTWLQIGGALLTNAWGGRSGLELGTEFAPFTLGQWAELLILPPVMALTALGLSWRRRREAQLPLAFALTAVLLGVATVRTARFVEYFVPFTVVALGLALNGVRWRPVRLAPVALLFLAVMYQGREEAELLGRLREWSSRVPGYVATAMRAAIPEGSQVFTCEWGMTGYLMQVLPGRRFLVALDPTFFQAKDPELYALWYASTRRPPPEVASLVRNRFRARYVVCLQDAQFQEFANRLATTPGVRTVLVSEDWGVYDLGVSTP